MITNLWIAMALFSTLGYADVKCRRLVLPATIHDEIQNPAYLEKSGEITARLVGEEGEATPAQQLALKASIDENRVFIEQAVQKLGGEAPRTWFYPFSGYDLATLVSIVPEVRTKPMTFVLMDGSVPFVSFNTEGRFPKAIGYLKEDLTKTASTSSGGHWGVGVTNKYYIANKSEKYGGNLPSILGRMETYFGKGGYRVKKITYYKDKSYIPAYQKRLGRNEKEYRVHGSILFDLGEGTPVHEMIYIHGSLGKGNKYMAMGELRTYGFDNPIFEQIDGIFIQGSQGGFQPEIHGYGPNEPREAFLDILTKNKGVLIEGMDQHPDAGRDAVAAWEVTLDIERAVQTTDPHGRPVRIVEDPTLKHSYYSGTRVSRWGK